MDVVKSMIYTALQADNVTTYGLRTLLGQSVTPYGIYHANLPENFDFTSGKKYVTYYQLTGEFDTSYPRDNFSTIVKQETYQITVWGGDATTSNDKLLDRVRFLLSGKHRTADPSTDAMVFNIKCEWEGPDQWDEDYKIFFRSARFRVWIQDYTIENNTIGTHGIGKNLLKGIQATLTNWDTPPNALLLTDEDFDNYTTGSKTTGNYGTIGTMVWDLGKVYSDLIISGHCTTEAANNEYDFKLYISNDGITYPNRYDIGFVESSYAGNIGFPAIPLSGRYIKIEISTGGNPAMNLLTVNLYEIIAFQYK